MKKKKKIYKLLIKMSCENPILAVRFPYKNESGKDHIKIVSQRSDLNISILESRWGKENVLKLPCGRCVGCKESYRIDWSVRCDMEARYYIDNCFITLTYRPECRPRWLSKGHLRRFIKKLNKAGINCRYFACGEYGENGTQAPHYHLILFGYFPSDAVLVPDVKSKSGFETYESKFLNELWNKGFVSVNNFSQKTSFYVAGYVNKKTGKFDGFLNMSRGLGYQYMIDNYEDLNESRLYIGRNGHVFRVPRAFKRVAEKLGHKYQEDPEDVINMRKLENSEMVIRGYRYREQLITVNNLGMKDRLQKRLKRL